MKWYRVMRQNIFFYTLVYFFSVAFFYISRGGVYNVISSIQKQFSFSTSEFGILTGSVDFAGLIVTIPISYTCHQRNIPRLSGFLFLLAVIANVALVLPNFVLNSQTLNKNGLNNTHSYEINKGQHPHLCQFTGLFNHSKINHMITDTMFEEHQRSYSKTAFLVFLLGFLLMGAASAPLPNVSLAYIANNSYPPKTALFIGIAQSSLAFGTTIGAFVAAWAVTKYVDLSEPEIAPSHPDWIGAWWLVMLFTMCGLVITSPWMFCFPKRMITQFKTKDTICNDYSFNFNQNRENIKVGPYTEGHDISLTCAKTIEHVSDVYSNDNFQTKTDKMQNKEQCSKTAYRSNDSRDFNKHECWTDVSSHICEACDQTFNNKVSFHPKPTKQKRSSKYSCCRKTKESFESTEIDKNEIIFSFTSGKICHEYKHNSDNISMSNIESNLSISCVKVHYNKTIQHNRTNSDDKENNVEHCPFENSSFGNEQVSETISKSYNKKDCKQSISETNGDVKINCERDTKGTNNNAKKFKLRKAIEAFWSSAVKLLKNPVYLCLSLSRIPLEFVYWGYYSYTTKYIEIQFSASMSTANIVSGTALAMMGITGIIAGTLISRFKISYLTTVTTMAVVLIALVIVLVTMVFVGCPDVTLADQATTEHCSNLCNCHDNLVSPVCDVTTGISYKSGCHAGCVDSVIIDNSVTAYSGCNCTVTNKVIPGLCSDCTDFPIYVFLVILMYALMGFLSSPLVSVTLSSVEEKNRIFAMGLSTFMCAILACFTMPVIYGAVIDAACDVWQKLGDAYGYCHIYSRSSYRIKVHAMTASVVVIQLILTVAAAVLIRQKKITWKTHSVNYDKQINIET